MDDLEMFWVVWQPDYGLPKFRHPDESLAIREAERLASLHPGRVFYVMQATHASELPSPQPITRQLEAALPF